ncbi:hypothetical protein GCM10022251_36940 [Phytohabitans flavus]|uniref:Uncharacterized protein n=1 Tax=Phytohabitans flavus TaxID=1076124 RepID=A0A6F8XW14_9ACTN|nr:hypothetical protein Pflav_044130 [Phytohabitans flavus]
MSGWQVKNIDQGRVFIHGMVKVSDLPGAVRVRRADELPDTVVGVVALALALALLPFVAFTSWRGSTLLRRLTRRNQSA